MAIIERDLQKTAGSATEHPTPEKPYKGEEILGVKFPGIEEHEGMSSEEAEKSDNETEMAKPGAESVSVKTPQVEKRKQEGNDWKTLKKVDYQRLETVLEEVQSLSEATSSKINYESRENPNEGEQNAWDFGHVRAKKPWLYNLVSITEQPEVLSGDDAKEEDEKQIQEETKKRCDKMEIYEAHGEPVESRESNGKVPQDKRSVVLNGMMEILPIFSNDKFVCSRDAISLEEYEEMEGLDKSLPTSGKFVIDSKTSRDSRTIDIKPFHSVNSVKKGFKDRFAEKLKDSKEAVLGKLQCREQIFTESPPPQRSSHFINFLLVLTPFAEEREKLLRQNGEGDVAAVGKGFSLLRIVCRVILTTFGLISVGLGFAWRSYKPPGIMDYVLSLLPFVHHRRTHIEVFFDNLIKIILSVLNRRCKNSITPSSDL